MPLSVGELETRYGVARNAIRNRLAGLGITPQQDGRHRVVSVDDVLLLDELDAHLKDGGTVASFLRLKGMAIATLDEEPMADVQHPDHDTDHGGELLAMPAQSAGGGSQMELLLTAIASVAQSRPASPTERYEFLDKAAAAGWEVTTADLRWATDQKQVKAGQWRGYTLERVGRGLFKVHHAESGKTGKPKKGKG